MTAVLDLLDAYRRLPAHPTLVEHGVDDEAMLQLLEDATKADPTPVDPGSFVRGFTGGLAAGLQLAETLGRPLLQPDELGPVGRPGAPGAMSGLVTLTWFVDGDEQHTETVPHDLAEIHWLERSFELVCRDDKHRVTMKLEFDPPVRCPRPAA